VISINTYYEENIKLYNGDSLIVMDDLIQQDIKFNAIITDPPYDISRNNNFHTMGRQGIDFGKWDKGFDQFSWINKAYKLLHNGGTLFIFNDWKNVGEIAKYSESLGFEIKDMIRWEKSNPMPRNRDRRYITDFEVAIWLVKPKGKWTFNRLSDTYDRCLYKYPLVSQSEKTIHTTQKPVALMTEIIQRHTNTGDYILDPFCGSGTTLVSAKKSGRKCVGIELEEKYFEVAKQRLLNKI
jgi:site-specific DNA-methyltransferase (adenine-specific)/modification methylase